MTMFDDCDHSFELDDDNNTGVCLYCGAICSWHYENGNVEIDDITEN